MYSPRVEPDKVQRLHKLREMMKAVGEKTDMIKLVNEALERYLLVKEDEVKRKLEQQNGRQCDG